MTRRVRLLVARATREFATDGVIQTDTMMALAAEGYDLDVLEDDVAQHTQHPH